MARALAPLALVPLLLLAGCASPGGETAVPPAPAADPTTMPDAGQGTDAAAAPAAQQVESLGWLVSGAACAHSQATQEALWESLRPELEGITYDAAAVDPASIGQPWSASVPRTADLVGFEVTFWAGAVGPGGDVVGFQVGLPPFEGDATVEGKVPEGSEFVSVFGCSATPANASYVADLAPALALLG